MQISVEATTALERRMTIGLPAEKIDAEVEKRLLDTARRVRIDGFRPGKVPASVVRQRYGAGIRHEVISDVMRSSFVEAVSKEELKLAGVPEVMPTKDKAGEPFEFTATFEVYPELKLAGFDKYKFVRQSTDVTDADVDKMLVTLQEQRATYSPVKRKSKKADQVTCNFVGKIDGEEFEGGKAEDAKIILGSGQMIPGFESGIKGMKAGEEQAITVTFPKDYQAEELAGKEAVFDVTVTDVSAPQFPELDEEFFKSFHSGATDVEGFKVDVKANMQRESRQALAGVLKTAVVDSLIASNEFDVPKALVDDEINRLREQAVQQYGGGKMDPASLPAELFQEQATRRVKVGLIMSEIISVNDIKADDASVTAYLEDMAAVYQEPASVIEYYRNNPEQMSQIQAVVIEEAVIQKVLEASKVTEKTIKYDDAIKLARG